MGTNGSEDDLLYKEVGDFFLHSEKLHDVEFIVGIEQERIRAVRLQLINQSRVWWSMLSEDSPLAEKGNIHLPDIEPQVFNLVLKHSYGSLDNLDSLTDETVIKLCYCASKYLMESLMKKIAARLEPKDTKSVFTALRCFILFNLQGVEEGIKKIVQAQTTKIFDHQEFLECDSDMVTYICKQESLNCDELTLWRAAVECAKHKAQGGEVAQLRQWMSQPLQHIRLLTLSAEDLRDHVFPSEILSYSEIINLCKGDVADMPTLSNKRVVRYIEKTVDIKRNIVECGYVKNCSTSCSSVIVKNTSIVLESIVVRGVVADYKEEKGFGLNKISTDVTIKFFRLVNIANTVNSTTDLNEDLVLEIQGFEHYYYDHLTIPTLINNKGIILQANSKYRIELSFSRSLRSWTDCKCIKGHNFDHGTFYCSWDYDDGIGKTNCHIVQFTYRLAAG